MRREIQLLHYLLWGVRVWVLVDSRVIKDLTEVRMGCKQLMWSLCQRGVRREVQLPLWGEQG